MNKTFIILLFLLPQFLLFGQTDSISRWSVSLGAGPSVFDGDVSQTRTQVFPTSFQELSFGASIEYNFTPAWGLSLDFYHFPLSGENNSIGFRAPLSSVNLNATVNFIKIIFPYNSYKFSFIGNIGLGYAVYNSKFHYKNPVNSPTESLLGVAVTIPVAFDFEYNLSKKIALGMRVQYRSLNKDNIEGAAIYDYKGVTNDFIGAGALYLKYKFAPKGKKNIRNIHELFKETERDTISKEIAIHNSKTDSILCVYAEKIKNQDKKIDSLLHLLAQQKYDNDFDKRLKEPQKSPVRVTPVLKADVAKVFNEALRGIQFETNKDIIKPTSFDILNKVVTVLKENTIYKIEINGHTDNMGDASKNLILSQKRAEAVKQYLISKGVSKTRLFSKGFGITQPIAGNDTPEGRAQNRRVEFKVFL